MAQTESFGELNFGRAVLGDARRTKRLVSLVDQMCQRPGGSLPQKFRSPADLRAFYRLMNADDVTHEAILDAHRQAVLRQIAQAILLTLTEAASYPSPEMTHSARRL